MGEGMLMLWIVGVLFGLVFGLGLVAVGYQYRQKVRSIEDTPTSPIRHARAGRLEVTGVVRNPTASLVFSPFSGRRAAYVRSEVKRLVSAGKSSYWKTERSEERGGPLVLDDGSGRMLIAPTGAELELRDSNRWDSSSGGGLPGQVRTYLARKGIPHTGRLLVEEKVIMPGTSLYALGRAFVNPHIREQARRGEVSPVSMIKSREDGFYLISDRSEEDLLREYRGKMSGALAAGWFLLLVTFGAVVANLLGLL